MDKCTRKVVEAMNKTRIEYLDCTWNPTVGCTGEGCAVREKCWARRSAKRQKERCLLCYDFRPHVHLERLTEPYHRNKPSRIGVSFMGDLFDEKIIRVRYWDQVFASINRYRSFLREDARRK